MFHFHEPQRRAKEVWSTPQAVTKWEQIRIKRANFLRCFSVKSSMLYTTEIMDVIISKQSSKFIMEISVDVSFFMIIARKLD